MQRPNTINLNQLFLPIISILIIAPSVAQTSPPSFCGKIKIENPLSLQNTNNSSVLNQILLCKSQNLYFRTTLGFFPISSIDYKAKTLTISHRSCSSSLHYVSPKLLSAGFPTPQPNSLLLLNCLDQRKQPQSISSSSLYNCSNVSGCKAVSRFEEQNQERQSSSCWFINDSEQLDMGFHPKDLNCSHYVRVYKGSSEGIKLGTRISFDIPDKVPKICDECNKPQGNCGAGLKCICHPKECKDKLISSGASRGPSSGFIFFTVMMIMFLV